MTSPVLEPALRRFVGRGGGQFQVLRSEQAGLPDAGGGVRGKFDTASSATVTSACQSTTSMFAMLPTVTSSTRTGEFWESVVTFGISIWTR